MFFSRSLLGFLFLFTIACGSSGSSNPNPGTAGTSASAGTGGGETGGTSAGGAAGTGSGGIGGVVIVPTPSGTLFMDDFEAGVAKWNVTQGTCMAVADDTTVYNCINGGNEARALAGDLTWGEYTVQARVKVNAMDAGRRIYLAARFRDSNNWYGAAIFNDASATEVQLRKKVGGASMDIAKATYQIEIGTGTWYTLKLEVKGATLRLSVNGTIQLEATDTSFNSGQIALLVDRSDISWDDVIVTNP
jgi:hypothetical protein